MISLPKLAPKGNLGVPPFFKSAPTRYSLAPPKVSQPISIHRIAHIS